MSNGPTPGDQPMPVSIPYQQTVYYSGLVQASIGKRATLVDSNGTSVFDMESDTKSPAPNAMQGGWFTASDPSGNYNLTITNTDGSAAPMVLWDTLSISDQSGNTYFQSYTYIAEDLQSGNQDYNDCYVNLYWFTYTG